MGGDAVTEARVKKTRFTLIQPANERAASAVSAKRREPMRVRLRRGRTLTEIVSLVAWPLLAR